MERLAPGRDDAVVVGVHELTTHGRVEVIGPHLLEALGLVGVFGDGGTIERIVQVEIGQGPIFVAQAECLGEVEISGVAACALGDK